MTTINLAVHDGRIVTTSHAVAQHFGKRHDNVIQAIEKLECSDGFRLLNFQEMQNVIETHNGGSREVKSYEITKDGFAFLCMGFTGKKAAEWKEKYIAAFNAMEAGLQKNQPNATLPHYITVEQRGLILQLVDQLFPNGKDRAGVWARFGNHFALGKDGKNPRYYSLPANRFEEALEYLRKLPGRMKQAALPAPTPTQTGITITISDIGPNRRALVSSDGANRICIDFLPNEARILSCDEDLPKLIAEPGQVSRSLLPAIISAGAGRL